MIIKKIRYYLKYLGLLGLAKRIIFKPYIFIRNKILERKIFSKTNPEEIFNEIYLTNYWDEKQSRSGKGSSLESTQTLRRELPIILKKKKIYSILDIPCGDFYWFSKIIKNIDIDYTGADIVEKIIIKNKAFENKKIKFKKLNIIEDKLPDADALFCRDCLFHLSYHDIEKTLKNFQNTNFKYYFITNHDLEEKKMENRDISTGSFRFLDFHKKPFEFKKNYDEELYDKDFPETFIEKKILIYSKKNFFQNIYNYLK